MLRARAYLQLHRAADARASLDRLSTQAFADAVAHAEAPLLSAEAALQMHDLDAALRLAALGNAKLAAVRNPPARLPQLASSLQRDLDAPMPK